MSERVEWLEYLEDSADFVDDVIFKVVFSEVAEEDATEFSVLSESFDVVEDVRSVVEVVWLVEVLSVVVSDVGADSSDFSIHIIFEIFSAVCISESFFPNGIPSA